MPHNIDATSISAVESYVDAACSVYCDGPLLRTVQLYNLFNDSKYFVDMPMKSDPDDILQKFSDLTANLTEIPSELAMRTFIVDNFFEAGSDLLQWTLPDYQKNPTFIEKLDYTPYRNWAYSINDLWKDLGKIVNNTWVESNPSRHSFLPRPSGMVVPGGRFRESYYWDSYFTILGLLTCDMPLTAKSVIDNLLSDVLNFGFVPNGGRIYYLDRSQPPLLSDMVLTYFDYMMAFGNSSSKSAAMQYLNYSYTLLIKEYNWWMDSSTGHSVEVDDPDDATKSYILNRYFSNYTTPRPESYYVDYYNGYFNGHFPSNGSSASFSINDTLAGNVEFFHSIRGAAESGWDFSSRWIDSQFKMTGGEDLTTVRQFNITNIDTISIIPVDLNCIMYKFEKNMVDIASILEKKYGSSNYNYMNDMALFSERALNRKNAINSILWDSSNSKWTDFNITSRSLSSINALSSWSAPLWAGIIPESLNERDNVLSSLMKSQLIQKHGLLTTSLITEQQWDSPNAWPPLVLMTIKGLEQLGIPKSKELASNITSVWLDTCYNAHNKTGFMYEKYNAFEGTGGGGGEYEPQRGFGWTNGVALFLLNSTIKYDDSIDDTIEAEPGSYWTSIMGILVITIIVLSMTIFICSCYKYSKMDLKSLFKSEREESDRKYFNHTVPLIRNARYTSINCDREGDEPTEEVI